jgi:alpha-beta hydrolase superfamily lysophospholipase
MLGWVGNHPLLAGLIGGVSAVGIAMARAFEGVEAAPVDAAIISAIVVVVWMVLFYFLRSFFARQAIAQVEVRRDVEASSQRVSWLQDGEVLKQVESPTFALYSTSVPEHMLVERKVDQPWPVWLVISSEEERLVLETKITAGEASKYAEVADEEVAATDEILPTGLASELLGCADRAVQS